MCGGVSNATGTTQQYSMPMTSGGGYGDSSVAGASGGGAPMKMSMVGGASGAPMKGAPMKDVSQLGGGLPIQGGGPTDGAALVSNPQLQTMLQSLVQALTSLSQILASKTSGAAAGGGAIASTQPPVTTGVPAAATSTIPVGAVTLADGTRLS